MTEFGRTPLLTVDELAAMGYRMVIFPQTAFRVAMRSAGQACRAESAGTQARLARPDADAAGTVRAARLRPEEGRLAGPLSALDEVAWAVLAHD